MELYSPIPFLYHSYSEWRSLHQYYTHFSKRLRLVALSLTNGRSKCYAFVMLCQLKMLCFCCVLACLGFLLPFYFSGPERLLRMPVRRRYGPWLIPWTSLPMRDWCAIKNAIVPYGYELVSRARPGLLQTSRVLSL